MDDEDLTRLVARASAGDTRAFAQIILALEPELRRYVTRLVSPRGLVDDILQETVLRLWKGLSWLHEPSLLRPWSFRIATREAYRLLRRELKRDAHSADPSVLETVAVDFADPSMRLDIETHLPNLTPGPRLVVVAHYFEELSLDEIAVAIRVPLGTVKSRLASGLTQLRKRLGDTR